VTNFGSGEKKRKNEFRANPGVEVIGEDRGAGGEGFHLSEKVQVGRKKTCR